MRFGVREIANVTFRPLAAMDIGSQHFDKYQPCLYIDTATASNMEVATTTVYAQGGRGNARLIAWEGEKTATFTVTDALLSPISFAMLSGAGVLDSAASTKVVHLTVDAQISSDGTKIDLDTDSLVGYSLVASGKSGDANEGLNAYAMVLDEKGISVLDYLGDQEITQPQTAGATSLTLKTTANSDVRGNACRVDCYAIASAPVTTLTVDAENFGGTFYIEAETLFRDEATGQDFPATFVIPKGKIQGNFTFNMASTGDPSTFDFTIDCTVGSVRTIKNSKVLYAIDIVDSISASENHYDAAGVKDGTTSVGVSSSTIGGTH